MVNLDKPIASIDVGTNTIRLFIGFPDNGLRPLVIKRIICRLGEGFVKKGKLGNEAIERTILTLKDFSLYLEKYEVYHWRAVATGVVREAENSTDFLDKVRNETGITLDVIDWKEEAKLTLKGVLISLKEVPKEGLIFDIGGGSTEYIFSSQKEPVWMESLALGVVYLTEKHFSSDPPTREELHKMGEEIERELAKIFPLSAIKLENSSQLIGTAGTVTTLAAMDQSLRSYEPEKVRGYILKKDRISSIYSHLTKIPISERRKIPSLERGREDLILAGSAIVLKTIALAQLDGITVSDAGLLEGVALDLFERRVTIQPQSHEDNKN